MVCIKICVYAICKNEEKFVDRWYESIKDADGIFVLDTGSSDDSAKKLKKHGISVKEMEIKPYYKHSKIGNFMFNLCAK